MTTHRSKRRRTPRRKPVRRPPRPRRAHSAHHSEAATSASEAAATTGHTGASHVLESTFAGKDVGIPVEPAATGGKPPSRTRVSRTDEALPQKHGNTLVVTPFPFWLVTPPGSDQALPKKGPYAEENKPPKPSVSADSQLNAFNETFQEGVFPRNVTFPEANRFVLTPEPHMPEIAVEVGFQNFVPEKIYWRLQVRHVVCRHSNKGNRIYESVCRPLEANWRGTSSATKFTLFAAKADDGAAAPDPVTYDPDASDPHTMVMGGYGLLSVAAYPPGEEAPVVAHSHIRIRGQNPSPEDAQAYIEEIFEGAKLDLNFRRMALAAFTHESDMKHFRNKPKEGQTGKAGKAGKKSKAMDQCLTSLQLRPDQHKPKPLPAGTPVCKISFEWPYDPPDFPLVTFDFGVGISQYTQTRSQQITAAVLWNWKENVKQGCNTLFDKLKGTWSHPAVPPKTGKKGKAELLPPKDWYEWALRGWKGYNGSKDYLKGVTQSDFARKIPDDLAPTPGQKASLRAFALTEPRKDNSPWPR